MTALPWDPELKTYDVDVIEKLSPADPNVTLSRFGYSYRRKFHVIDIQIMPFVTMVRCNSRDKNLVRMLLYDPYICLLPIQPLREQKS